LARDTPYNMEWLALVVLLEDKDTRPFVIGRVLFHDGGRPDSCKDIPDQNTICRKFIIAVMRDEYLLTGYQASNALKDLTHLEALASLLRVLLHHVVGNFLFEGGIIHAYFVLQYGAEIVGSHLSQHPADFPHAESIAQIFEGR